MDLADDHGSIKIETVARLLEQSCSYDVLLQNWRQFSGILGVSGYQIVDLEWKIKRETLRPHDLLREILGIWRAKRGTDATLEALQKALVECGVNDMAESLMTPQSVKTFKFMWQGKMVTLEELLGHTTANETYQKLWAGLKKHLLAQPLQLVKDELIPPELPKYYIPRTLFCRSSAELDPSIFMSNVTRDHIFLIKGMTKSELARLTGYKELIDVSGNQLYTITARFILLDTDGDFDRICKNTSRAVHVIEEKTGLLFWVRSNKEVEIIRPFLKKFENNVNEQELSSTILSMTPPSALSIADSPGMGKTVLLANLAKKIQINNPVHSLHLFIVLHEFAEKLEDIGSNASAIEAIAAYASCSEEAKMVLEEMLSSAAFQVYLFLDGYDEVIKDNNLNLVNEFLVQVKELKNFNIIVTTRSHLQTRLENILSTFSYEIQPFNEANQVEFLTNYWKDQHGLIVSKVLETFARLCLQALEVTLTDTEKEIAGIPLQCMMLGEVYAADAKRASNLESLPPDFVVKPISLFNMYGKLIDSKFKRLRYKNLSKSCLNAHIHFATLLLYPDWYSGNNASLLDHWHNLKTFKHHLNGYDEIDETKLFSIGLLVKGPNSPRFIHRTFAEYLLAEFIVANLGKYRACVNFLLTQIFGGKGVTLRIPNAHPIICSYTLNNPVIAKFVEMHLAQLQSFDELIPTFHRSFFKENFHDEDVCVTIAACADNGLQYMFDYATSIFRHYAIRINPEFRELYFKPLPYNAILSNHDHGNVMILKRVLEFTNEQLKVDLRFHHIGCIGRGLNVPNFTPLHVAVLRGKYNRAMYLVQKYGDQVAQLKYLLHVCILKSSYDSKLVLEEKLLIIDMLVRKNRDWLNERDENECTPLLQRKGHLSLLQQLLKHGANINEYSSVGGTVLHDVPQEESAFYERAHWAFSNGFMLINHTDKLQRTPLMHAIKELGSVEEDVLLLFREKGTELDLNAKDENGDSVLFLALERVKNLKFINHLINHGADVHHRNKRNQNVVHKIIQGSGSSEDRLMLLDRFVSINSGWINERDVDDCTPLLQENGDLDLLQLLVEHGANINAYSSIHGTVLHRCGDKNNYFRLLKWALSNGFEGMNKTCGNMVTSLMHAIKLYGTIDHEVWKIFLENETDVNAKDGSGDSVLFYALRYSDCKDFIMNILEQGADIHHKNNLNQSAAHIVMKWRVNANHILFMLRFLKSEGLEQKQFCQKDSMGRTPLDIGLKRKIVQIQLCNFIEDLSKDGSGSYSTTYYIVCILFGVLLEALLSEFLSSAPWYHTLHQILFFVGVVSIVFLIIFLLLGIFRTLNGWWKTISRRTRWRTFREPIRFAERDNVIIII